MYDFFETYEKFILPAMLSFVAALARFAFSDKKSILIFLRGVIISCFAGAMMALALQDYEMGEGMKGAIVGVSAFCADEVLAVLITMAKHIKDDPMRWVRDYLNSRRGQ